MYVDIPWKVKLKTLVSIYIIDICVFLRPSESCR